MRSCYAGRYRTMSYQIGASSSAWGESGARRRRREHRRKSPAGGAHVRGLTLVEPGREQQNTRLGGEAAHIGLQGLSPVYDTRARCCEGLRDICRRRHRLPCPSRQLVATIAPSASEPCCRSEEVALALCPQRIPVLRYDFDRGRDHLRQHGRRGSVDPETPEKLRFSEHGKVALVRAQRV